MATMRIAVILMAIGAAVSCGKDAADSKQSPPAVTNAQTDDATYAEDVRRICNAQELSGALAEDENQRAIIVAQWLGDNLVTQRARDLMAQQARLDPAGKRALFLAEATKAGLSGCKTADAWQ